MLERSGASLRMTETRTEVYHASKTPLETGTVLEARFIKAQHKYQFDVVEAALNEPEYPLILKTLLLSDISQNRGKAYLTFALKETVLERIRRREFPDRPSRYKSIFACPTKADAARFRELIRQGDDRPHLHACSLVGDFFAGDLNYVARADPFAPIKKQIDYMIERARLYWQGQKSDRPVIECLAEPGAVTVTSLVPW